VNVAGLASVGAMWEYHDGSSVLLRELAVTAKHPWVDNLTCLKFVVSVRMEEGSSQKIAVSLNL
jgi:hypothetical protein